MLAVAVVSTSQTTGIKTKPGTDTRPESSAATKTEVAKSDAAVEIHNQKLFHIRSFIDRAMAFDNQFAAAETLADIAFNIWKFDEPLARDTYSKALAIVDNKKREMDDLSDYRASSGPAFDQRLSQAWRIVIARGPSAYWILMILLLTKEAGVSHT